MGNKLPNSIGWLFLLLFCLTANVRAQKSLNPLLTADSLASGNYKDVLTSFFQVGLNNLTDTNKHINFSSNLFAYMLKSNPSLNIDTNYVKYKFARNTNLDLNVKLNNKNQFNGFSLGFRYAILNGRDYTISKEFISLALSNNYDLYILHDSLAAKRSAIRDHEVRKKFKEQTEKLFNDSAFTFDKLDPDIRKIVINTAEQGNLKYFLNLVNHNPSVCLKNNAKDRYEEVKNSFQNKPLWTIGVNMSSYSDRFQLNTLNVSTEFLKGIINPNALSNLELNIKGNLGLGDDSTETARNLKRGIISWDAGINWVMKGWGGNQTFLEFKLSANQSRIFSGLYKGEEGNLFTVNGTLRFRISNNIWIPIQLKYDPKTGNVFGFLNITTNFTGFGKTKN